MWRSKDDVIRDLAFLNDFGVPGDKEPYKVLYSIGRGTSVKAKSKNEEKFVDQRTGEVINAVDDISNTNDTYYQSKGRGSFLGSYSKTKLQLQQQLRLARPLGSGDGAIESYYRRNVITENPVVPLHPSSSKSHARNSGTPPEKPKEEQNSHITHKRVKATRNQNSYSNVLIANLLSKAKAESDGVSVAENSKKNFNSEVGYCENNNNNCSMSSSSCCSSTRNSFNSCSSSTDSSQYKDSKRTESDSSPEDFSALGGWKYSDENCGTCKKCKETTTVLGKIDMEGLKIIDDDEVNEESHLNRI